MSRVIVDKVVEDLYLLRVDDERVKYFEALWRIPEGITYNAYVLTTDEGAVLFDTWKRTYAEEFVDALRKVVEPRDIHYLVVHHVEPDHSGAIPKFLEANGFRARVLGHPLSGGMLESFYGVKRNFKPVKDEDELEVGGKRLRFIHTPWLHWPETMMTYLYGEKVLLSGDAFGGFSMPSKVFDEDEGVVSEYMPAVRKYVATIIGHYRKHVARNVEKVKGLGLDVRIIAPAHELLWRNPSVIMDYYLELAEARPRKGKVLIAYSSMYGAVEEAVSTASEELSNLGFSPLIIRFTDGQRDYLSDLIGEAIDSEALIVAASTYEGDVFPYVRFAADLLSRKAASGKPVLVLSSYGWGGVAGRKLAEMLSTAGFKVVEVVEFKGSPDAEVKGRIKEAVEKLAQEIRGL